jgi:recombination protein RecA
MGRRARSETTSETDEKAEALAIGETSADRLKQVDLILSGIEKKWGKGTVRYVTDKNTSNVLKVEVIDAGSWRLNEALGIGGWPRGRLVEIYGEEATGKTTLCLEAIREIQRVGGLAAYVDAEHALDIQYCKNLGINTDRLLVSQPDYGEQGLSIVEDLLGAVDLVIIDSIAALVPKAELEGDIGDIQPGLQARMMGQALRKLTGKTHRTNTCVIFINQLREKIGVTMPGASKKTTTGGKALKFYASVRVEVARIGSVKRGDKVVGNRVKVKIVKNKLAPPQVEFETEIIFGKGINAEGELLDAAIEHGIVTRSGSWFSCKDERISQGREHAEDHIREHPELRAEIIAAIRPK